MVGPFGGITAAIMVRAIETHPERIGSPLALTINFAAPIADGDFDITLDRAHQPHQPALGDRTQADNEQDHCDRPVRHSPRHLGHYRSAATERAAAGATDSPRPGRTDFWQAADQTAVRLDGAVSTARARGSPSSTTTLWARDVAERRDYPALAALADIFFPQVFLRRGEYLPAGTVR